jgi:hypothetical protein
MGQHLQGLWLDQGLFLVEVLIRTQVISKISHTLLR